MAAARRDRPAAPNHATRSRRSSKEALGLVTHLLPKVNHRSLIPAIPTSQTENPPLLNRFPIRWNHLIEKKSFRFKELEHGLIDKVTQLFRNMLWTQIATSLRYRELRRFRNSEKCCCVFLPKKT